MDEGFDRAGHGRFCEWAKHAAIVSHGVELVAVWGVLPNAAQIQADVQWGFWLDLSGASACGRAADGMQIALERCCFIKPSGGDHDPVLAFGLNAPLIWEIRKTQVCKCLKGFWTCVFNSILNECSGN